MDKKEEVIDIELTPYGKQLLSMGKMKPVYYAFFDDNIIYDAEYGGITEGQNIIQQRITELTPQLQTQYKFTSKGKEGSEVDFGNGEKISTIAPLKKNALSSDLGSTRLSGQNYPAINLRMLSGEIKDVDLTYTTEFGQKKIPQINLDVTYNVEVGNVSVESSRVEVSPMDDTPTVVGAVTSANESIISRIAIDGSYLSITPQIILADIVEKNTDFKIDNFDIEAYEVGDTLIPLTFAKNKKNNVVNNILLDEVPEEDRVPVSLSPNNVEYYFDIFVDSDIDEEVINNSISLLKSKGLYTDKDYVNEDNVLIREVISDIYGTNVTVTDIKDC
jgi:hypothetical protein